MIQSLLTIDIGSDREICGKSKLWSAPYGQGFFNGITLIVLPSECRDPWPYTRPGQFPAKTWLGKPKSEEFFQLFDLKKLEGLSTICLLYLFKGSLARDNQIFPLIDLHGHHILPKIIYKFALKLSETFHFQIFSQDLGLRKTRSLKLEDCLTIFQSAEDTYDFARLNGL